MASCDLSAQNGADCPVHVAHLRPEGDRSSVFNRAFRFSEQLMIERFPEAVVLTLQLATADARRNLWIVKDSLKVETTCLPMFNARLQLDQVDSPDHFVHCSETELRHPAANLFRNKEEEVHDVLGRACKLLAQFGILRGDPDGASIEVALAHHDAAHGDQRR